MLGEGVGCALWKACRWLAPALSALMGLGACTEEYQPTARQTSRPAAAERNKYFYTPGPGKTQFMFNEDRIQCTYAIKPWTVEEFKNCMLARGDLAFEWSSIKSPVEIQNDSLECSHAIVHRLIDEGEREFESCLEARKDLLAAGTEGEFLSREKTQAYLAPPPVPPETMCSNFARGDQQLFSQCMDNSQHYAESYCLDATNRQAEQYTECMAARGFPASALPEMNPSAAISPPISGDSSLTVNQQSVLDALKGDLIEAAERCGFEFAVIKVVFDEKGQPLECFGVRLLWDHIFTEGHPSLSSIWASICEKPRVLMNIPYVTESVADGIGHILLCRTRQ